MSKDSSFELVKDWEFMCPTDLVIPVTMVEPEMRAGGCTMMRLRYRRYTSWKLAFARIKDWWRDGMHEPLPWTPWLGTEAIGEMLAQKGGGCTICPEECTIDVPPAQKRHRMPHKRLRMDQHPQNTSWVDYLT